MSRPHLAPGSSLAVAISVFERSTLELVDICHREHRAITPPIEPCMRLSGSKLSARTRTPLA